jgi:hypothetical protein
MGRAVKAVVRELLLSANYIDLNWKNPLRPEFISGHMDTEEPHTRWVALLFSLKTEQ